MSSNLVTSLFPMMKKAIEKNKPGLAKKYLKKAKEWITDIITKVDDMVKRYDQHNKSVKTCTSDGIDINKKLKQLHSDKLSLKSEEWTKKIQLTDLQLKLAKYKIQMGEIPDPDHLQEVQLCLSQIQQILTELKTFWKKVDVVLSALKDKTFVGKELFELMEDMKDELLSSIDDAVKYWKMFGMSCQRAQGIFSVQSRDAFKFLEINPSSLSEAEREKEYASIMEKLHDINAKGLSRAAITPM